MEVQTHCNLTRGAYVIYDVLLHKMRGTSWQPGRNNERRYDPQPVGDIWV